MHLRMRLLLAYTIPAPEVSTKVSDTFRGDEKTQELFHLRDTPSKDNSSRMVKSLKKKGREGYRPGQKRTHEDHSS